MKTERHPFERSLDLDMHSQWESFSHDYMISCAHVGHKTFATLRVASKDCRFGVPSIRFGQIRYVDPDMFGRRKSMTPIQKYRSSATSGEKSIYRPTDRCVSRTASVLSGGGMSTTLFAFGSSGARK